MTVCVRRRSAVGSAEERRLRLGDGEPVGEPFTLLPFPFGLARHNTQYGSLRPGGKEIIANSMACHT